MRSFLAFYFCPLRSGSSGNVLFAQAGDARILIDAGLSGRMVESLLQEVQAPPDTFSAILVTHEHSDHIKGVGILSKRWGIPVYATAGTWAEMDAKGTCGNILPENRRVIQSGENFYIRDLCVQPFSIPHDAREPVGYSLLYEGLAWVDRATCKSSYCRRWYIVEHNSVESRKGLWSLELETPPWQWSH